MPSDTAKRHLKRPLAQCCQAVRVSHFEGHPALNFPDILQIFTPAVELDHTRIGIRNLEFALKRSGPNYRRICLGD